MLCFRLQMLSILMGQKLQLAQWNPIVLFARNQLIIIHPIVSGIVNVVIVPREKMKIIIPKKDNEFVVFINPGLVLLKAMFEEGIRGNYKGGVPYKVHHHRERKNGKGK